MTTVLIHRNAPTDSCRNLTALMPRCTKTSFLITPHYICAHRNSDNLHNAAFKGYSLVGEWRMSTVLWSYINSTRVAPSSAPLVVSASPLVSSALSCHNLLSSARLLSEWMSRDQINTCRNYCGAFWQLYPSCYLGSLCS